MLPSIQEITRGCEEMGLRDLKIGTRADVQLNGTVNTRGAEREREGERERER